MTRTALLVEHEFLEHHVGVRNFAFALHAHLSTTGHAVQFLSRFRPAGSVDNWYRVHLRNPRLVRDNGIRADWKIVAPAKAVLDIYHATAAEQTATDWRSEVWYTQIGTRLEAAGLDQVVITNPWLVDFPDRLPVPRLLGVAHDAIPNRYVFSQPAKPFEFATRHLTGYQYFRKHCDATLTNSRLTAEDLIDLFRFPADRVIPLPPMIPSACLTPAVEPVERRPGAVLLASPLDPRKGLAAMPGLIRGLGDDAAVLLMYGGVRCPPADLPAFFAALPPDLPVEWYPRATAATTERLFRQAKLLLFPSESEGLGLPLIEAQLRGCPVVVRPKRPMTDLLVHGSRTLPGTPAGDQAVVSGMMRDERFDHDRFEAAARAFFGTDTLAARVAAAVRGT